MILTINKIPVSKYGAKMHADYIVSGAQITSTYQKPRNGSTFVVVGHEAGIKTLTIKLDVFGRSPTDTKRKISELDSLASSGKVEITLPDGFAYTAVLQSITPPVRITDCIYTCSYVFVAVQHEDMIRMVTDDGYIFANGTMPRMDCVLKTAVGAAANSYNFAGVTFTGVKAGDVLVLDGITKRVLVNGAPGAQKCNLGEFPYLAPGSNHIICPDTVTVEYYPAYL